MVSCNHDWLDSCLDTFRNCIFRLHSWRIHHGDKAEEGQAVFIRQSDGRAVHAAAGEGQHPQALVGKLFVDLFDTLGTLIGVASKADMLDEDGKLPHIKGALTADSIATCAGAVLGTSTTTTFVESASGVTEGGRTGLTSMTTGVLFLLAVVFSPLFLTIPSFATAPALIIVGFYMMGSALKIEFDDPAEGIPAFLTILAMPTAYSISEGIAIGVISWTLLNVITGKAKEKKISPLMYVLTVLFILKYVLL